MPISSPIDTPTRSGEYLSLPVAADTALYAGGLAALDGDGNVVPASDTAGLKVIGRVERDADNRDGAAGDISVTLRRGVFRLANSADDTLTKADVGTAAIVEDDATVGDGSTPSNDIVAGLILSVDADGVWVDTRLAQAL